jgi:hypothetical protein
MVADKIIERIGECDADAIKSSGQPNYLLHLTTSWDCKTRWAQSAYLLRRYSS